MEIAGSHNLNNASFLSAVLQTGLRLLKEANKNSERPFELATKIANELSLPSNEIILISNAIAPRFSPAATVEYLEKALARLSLQGKAVIAKTIEVDPVQSQAVPPNKLERQRALKQKIIDLLQEKKIIPGSYLRKTFSEFFDSGQISLIPFSQTFTLNEANWCTVGEIIVSLPGYETSKESLARQILIENGHKPFPINKLAERYGLSTQKTIDDLKARKFGSLFLWSPYDVWSIADIVIDEKRQENIRKFVMSRGETPILIEDAFNWVVGGIVARNLYSEIFLDSKISAIDKAFSVSGVTDYECNKKEGRYVSKKIIKEKNRSLEPLYKPLWEEE